MLEGVVEGLDVSVEVLVVLLELLVDVVDRCLVTRETKGSVAAVLPSNRVEILESLSEATIVRLVWSIEWWLTYLDFLMSPST